MDHNNKVIMNRLDRLLEKITPHICLAEWGRADMETILADALICAEKKLPAISALPGALSVLGNAAGNTKVYCFIDDTGRLPELAGRKNISVQLFLKDNRIETAPDFHDIEIIPAFALKNIEHLDWTQIVLTGKRLGNFGFMFIDDNGKYIHKFYNFLDLIGESFHGAVHYCGATNDIAKLDDAYRLVEKVRPNILPDFRIFVSGDFFRTARFLDIRNKSV